MAQSKCTQLSYGDNHFVFLKNVKRTPFEYRNCPGCLSLIPCRYATAWSLNRFTYQDLIMLLHFLFVVAFGSIRRHF